MDAANHSHLCRLTVTDMNGHHFLTSNVSGSTTSEVEAAANAELKRLDKLYPPRYYIFRNFTHRN